MCRTYESKLPGILLACLCLGAALGVLVPRQGWAQVLYGAVVGNVTDPSGGAIVGATVTITNKNTNLSRTTTSDAVGAYNFPNVVTGGYDVKISAQGFATFTKTDVPVTINSITRVDFTLQVGAVTESVTVGAEAAVLQSDRAEVRSEMLSQELVNLPVPLGRNYQYLFRTLPGFSVPGNAHSIPTNPSRALVYHVNGSSVSTNNTKIDGSSANSANPHITAYVPGLESIQTVNLVTNSFDAEQGLAGGAVINVQIKSGTNDLHGSAFEYHSDQHLKAKPFFSPPGQRNPKLVYNQFGGTLGGPIKKDKLFYFLSYEGTPDRRNVALFTTVPTAVIKSGDMSASSRPIYDPASGNARGENRTAFPDNIVPLARQSAISRKIASLTPLPNLDLLQNNYYASGPFSYGRHTVDSKVNWNVSQKLNMFGRLSFLHFESYNRQAFGDALGGPPLGGGNPGYGHGTSYSMTLAATYIASPSFIVDGSFGYIREVTNSEQPRLNEKVGLDFLGIPGTNGPRRFEGGWPRFQVSNYTVLGIDSAYMPYNRQNPQYQYLANVDWAKGTHDIRFGVEVNRLHQDTSQPELTGAFHGASGGFTFAGGPTLTRGGPSSNQFNTYGTFLLGLPTRIGRILQVPDQYSARLWLHSLYVRDRWNVTPRLTLSYGVRWEYLPLPTRADRGLELYDPDTNEQLICGVGSVPRDCGIAVSKKRFVPRLGLAYRATSTFVIRAGYGITNDPFPLSADLSEDYPNLVPLNIEGPNSFQPAGRLENGIPPITAPDLSTGRVKMLSNIVTNSPSNPFRRGYLQSWNLTLQKQLPYGFAGQAGYVATREVRHLGFLDLNAGQEIGAGEDGRPLLRRFGRTADTLILTTLGSFHYDSLQASLERRFTQGLQLAVHYTWSKNIGLAGVGYSDDQPQIQALRYFSLNRAVVDYDRPHNLQISNVWELPFGRGRRWIKERGVASAILGGWQVNNVLSFVSGLPFFVTGPDDSLDLPGSTQRADQVKPHVQKLGGVGRGQSFFDPLAYAPVTEPRFGTAGFNSLRGPGVVNWDFGLFREFRVAERWKIQFRAESFNFSNTPHFRNPGTDVSNMTLNANGTIRDLGGYTAITSTATNVGRELIDERQFRVGLHVSF